MDINLIFYCPPNTEQINTINLQYFHNFTIHFQVKGTVQCSVHATLQLTGSHGRFTTVPFTLCWIKDEWDNNILCFWNLNIFKICPAAEILKEENSKSKNNKIWISVTQGIKALMWIGLYHSWIEGLLVNRTIPLLNWRATCESDYTTLELKGY